MKATAKAYAIQGLVKYHGLRDPAKRIPYHDSISVCMKSLQTTTTVETDPSLLKDNVVINGKVPRSTELKRVAVVVDTLRDVAGKRVGLRVESRNSDVEGKGLGFSAAGFAALGLATSEALRLDLGYQRLSEIVRLGAGSASRSLLGGFSIWYANMNGRSYAEQLASPSGIKLRTIIAPVASDVKTDTAHRDSIHSPFYQARLKYVKRQLSRMKRALTSRDVPAIGSLAEEDTLNLHAVTMTGPSEMILVKPVSLSIIQEVRRLREEEEVPVWFSLDTGPSVFINTIPESVERVKTRISRITKHLIVSEPGGRAELVKKHLF